MKKNKTLKLAASILTIFAIFAVGCGGHPSPPDKKNNPVKKMDQTAKNTPENNDKSAQSGSVTDKNQSGNATNNDATNQIDPSKLPVIPPSNIKTSLDSQLAYAMAVIPEKALETTTQNPVSYLLFNNLGKLVKLYDIKPGSGVTKGKEEFSAFVPPVLLMSAKSPKNSIEEPTNWYWSVVHRTFDAIWLAGKLSLDKTLMKAMDGYGYEKAIYPGTGLAVYQQKAQGLFPKYGQVIVPLASDLCFFKTMIGDTTLANETFKNVNIDKTLGLLQKDTMKDMFALCGDPVLMILAASRLRPFDVLSKMPKNRPNNVTEVFDQLKGYERNPGLMATAFCFDPKLERPLRIVFCYENVDQLNEDFPKLAYIWGKIKFGGMDWKNIVQPSDVKFSKSLNCGIVECKTNKKLPLPALQSIFLSSIRNGDMSEILLR